MIEWRRIRKYVAGVFLVIGCLISAVSITFADSLRSTNYQFDESFVGGSGLIQSNSANYQFDDSIGDTAVGNSASTNFQINAGSTTTADPALTFRIIDGVGNFNSFSPTNATVTTSTFSVTNYTSYGYVVQMVGSPPNSGTHTLSALAANSPSQVGVEQFGINLVANTSPVSVGANPDHGQFGFGSATANYGSANSYRFVNGESIVSAPKSSGETIYTISYLINVNARTPSGEYASNQVLVCTGTY